MTREYLEKRYSKVHQDVINSITYSLWEHNTLGDETEYIILDHENETYCYTIDNFYDTIEEYDIYNWYSFESFVFA